MKVEELINTLEPQIKYLSNIYKIPGMEKEDVQQELRLMVVNDFKKYPQESYNEGWWFKRLKWFLINKSMKEAKEPVNRSVRIHKFTERD